MSGPSLTEVRRALADTLSDNLDVGVYTYAEVEDHGNLPAIIIEPESSDFAETFKGGVDVWNFLLLILVDGADEVAQQNTLDEFVTGRGPNSIRQILLDNKYLGLPGKTAVAHCTRMWGYGGQFPWAGVKHVGALLNVQVTVSN
jgi:hypothetical protein